MSLKTLAARLQYDGGDALGRINMQKLRSLKAALKNDYNSRQISFNNAMWYGLINDDNLKPDYDRKIVSIPFDAGLEAGDVFEILDDGTHWMVYLPHIAETAYLQSDIIRCRYTIEIDDEIFWVYFQGPTETDVKWYLKTGINYSELNYSGTIFIKNTPKTRDFFERFTILRLDGHNWEVQVKDRISVPGIIELEVQEYYDNTPEDLPEIIHSPEISNNETIIGETVVKQDEVVGYQVNPLYYDPKAEWSIKGNERVRVKEVLQNGRTCTVRIYPGAVRTFILCYGKQELEVTIDWAKPYIQGPQEVHPFETHTYWIKDKTKIAHFGIDDLEKAGIVEIGSDYCKIEILTSKKGSFNIRCRIEDDENSPYYLPVTIKSI